MDNLCSIEGFGIKICGGKNSLERHLRKSAKMVRPCNMQKRLETVNQICDCMVDDVQKRVKLQERVTYAMSC